MKISPVQGIPTIQNLAATGLSAEKLSRIKSIASNQTPEAPAPTESEEPAAQLTDSPTSNTRRIKMNVNQSQTMPIAQENAPLEEPVAISDNSVQAKPIPEAIGSVSPELAQLAKERRALQIEREQLAKDRAALQGVPEGYVPLKDLQTNALSVLQKHGVTYEQLTNEILGQQGDNELNSLRAKVDALEKGIDEKLSAKDTAQEESVYSYMALEVDKLSNLEPYRFIREYKAQDKVMELVKRTWKEKGEVLTEDEAMNLIETELRDDARRYAKLIGELEKPAAPAEIPPAKQQIKTLTNKDSARPVMSRRQRALAAALGQK